MQIQFEDKPSGISSNSQTYRGVFTQPIQWEDEYQNTHHDYKFLIVHENSNNKVSVIWSNKEPKNRILIEKIITEMFYEGR